MTPPAVAKLGDIPHFAALLSASFAAFSGWSILLPVIPLAIARSGGTPAQAGAATTAFMAATVAAQLFVSRLLRCWDYRSVLLLGCALLSLPCLALIAPAPLMWWYGLAAVRGIGFGLLTVATTAALARLAPRAVLGRAAGMQGVVIGSAVAVTLPGGLAIANFAGVNVVLTLGAVLPAIAAVGLFRLTSLRERAAAHTQPAPTVRRRLLVTSVVMASTGATFGGVTTLVPISASGAGSGAELSVLLIGVLSMVGRYGAGLWIDRSGPGRTLVPALICGTAGLAALGLGVHIVSPGLLAVASAAFGLAYGAIQTETLVLAYIIAGPEGIPLASTYYNIGIDMGIGVGAAVQGVVANLVGIPTAIAASGLFTLIAIGPALAAVGHLRRVR